MVDNSNFVLRWEIDIAAARFATGRVESEVFDQGGFKWTAAIKKYTASPNDMTELSLQCDVDNSGFCRCEAEVNPYLIYNNGRIYKFICKPRFCFEKDSDRWHYNSSVMWSTMTTPLAILINGKVILEFRIHVSAPRSIFRPEPIVDSSKFAAPNNRSDVILIIGEKKLHVSKEILAIHSPVFETMFFGDFAEKGKEEVEITDVVYKEFLDLLHVIYIDGLIINDRTVGHILKLADRFQMERVLNLSKIYLMQSKGFDVAKKLHLADQYRLTALRDKCLQSFTSATDLSAKLNSSAEYANFSLDTKGAICDRLMKLLT